jgi:hypothetical protein
MLENQIPLPPIEMVMPPYNDIIAIGNFVVLALVAIWLARESRRIGSALPLMILAGAVIASLQEPIYDIVGSVWYPHHNTVSYVRAFNVSIPLWLIPAYAWFIGGQGYLVYKKMQQGITVRQLWAYYFLGWVANLCLELPGLNLGIYIYYGAQPFKVFGFPLWMAMTNALMPLLVGAVLISLQKSLTGLRTLLALLLVPMVTGTAQITAGWPTWLALNSGGSLAVTHVAALVSMGLSMSIVYMVSLKFCVPAKVAATQGAHKVAAA